MEIKIKLHAQVKKIQITIISNLAVTLINFKRNGNLKLFSEVTILVPATNNYNKLIIIKLIIMIIIIITIIIIIIIIILG